jgi:hypothetical protein
MGLKVRYLKVVKKYKNCIITNKNVFSLKKKREKEEKPKKLNEDVSKKKNEENVKRKND